MKTPEPAYTKHTLQRARRLDLGIAVWYTGRVKGGFLPTEVFQRSGHSKWSTIKRKKEKTDGARAKVFTKISREIIVAVREGGGDPNNNSKLRDLISKAKSNNIPNDNIDRLIKKAVGDGDKNNYESIVYEGYGPSGVAVMVDALTDNRNRTAARNSRAYAPCRPVWRRGATTGVRR